MKVVAGFVLPGLAMEHRFVLPNSLLDKYPSKTSDGRPSYRLAVKKEFIDWCEGSLSGFNILQQGSVFQIMVCEDDYTLLKLKYFEKEKKKEWQRII